MRELHDFSEIICRGNYHWRCPLIITEHVIESVRIHSVSYRSRRTLKFRFSFRIIKY